MAAVPPETSEQGLPAARPRARVRAIAWAYTLVGIAMFATGCAALCLGPLAERSAASWVGASLLVVWGLWLCLLGRKARYPARASAAAPRGNHPDVTTPSSGEPDVLVPMLGALLAYKYQIINEWQLEKALAIQRKQGRRRQPLGRILLDMGLVTRSELEEALDHQKGYERRKRARPRDASSAPPR